MSGLPSVFVLFAFQGWRFLRGIFQLGPAQSADQSIREALCSFHTFFFFLISSISFCLLLGIYVSSYMAHLFLHAIHCACYSLWHTHHSVLDSRSTN